MTSLFRQNLLPTFLSQFIQKKMDTFRIGVSLTRWKFKSLQWLYCSLSKQITLLVLAFCMLKLAEDDVSELNMRGVKLYSYNSTQNITQQNNKRDTPVYPAHPLPQSSRRRELGFMGHWECV